ncbi:hypothetical protein KM043_006378 [Ampulex compressa]|nr:hypothetical protein KM043_006378 [Ampulex compressa]
MDLSLLVGFFDFRHRLDFKFTTLISLLGYPEIFSTRSMLDESNVGALRWLRGEILSLRGGEGSFTSCESKGLPLGPVQVPRTRNQGGRGRTRFRISADQEKRGWKNREKAREVQRSGKEGAARAGEAPAE